MSLPLLRVFSRLSLLLTAACVSETTTAPAATPSQDSPVLSPHRDAAFVVNVSTVRRKVSVVAPTSGSAMRTQSAQHSAIGAGMQMSLLGGDAVELLASNYSAGVIGAVVPGKVLVTFDLTLINRLRGLRLITPTFPMPPAHVTGIQAFPIEIVALSTSGQVTVTSGVITVTSPRSGAAVPSTDWDGAPHSFFNDVGCGALSSDCFRYEPFGTLEPLSASAARRVGFLVDPTVGDVRVRIIVAADLESVPGR